MPVEAPVMRRTFPLSEVVMMYNFLFALKLAWGQIYGRGNFLVDGATKVLFP
jgi:hypothetical protein